MENNINLYIPVKIKTRFEFFDGFGFTELIPTAFIAIMSAVISSVFHGITGGSATTPIIIVLISSAAAAFLLAKGANNLSVVDQIRQLIRFSRRQKIYKYRKINVRGGD